MAIGKRAAAWTVLAALAAGAATAGEVKAKPAIVIHLDNLVPVPANDLSAAKAEFERVFRLAGIDVAWQEGTLPAPAPGQLTLIIVNATSASEGGDVAGEAARSIGRAWVFANRLDAASKHLQTHAPSVLGRVMAHEIGHLLLPPHAHSALGIMRANVDFSLLGCHFFTADQAQTLRTSLLARP